MNDHLEKLLKRTNKNTNLQRHMVRHYSTRNMFSHIRVRNMKNRLSQTLMKLRKRDNLDILSNASLIVQPITQGVKETNFKQF